MPNLGRHIRPQHLIWAASALAWAQSLPSSRISSFQLNLSTGGSHGYRRLVLKPMMIGRFKLDTSFGVKAASLLKVYTDRISFNASPMLIGIATLKPYWTCHFSAIWTCNLVYRDPEKSCRMRFSCVLFHINVISAVQLNPVPPFGRQEARYTVWNTD